MGLKIADSQSVHRKIPAMFPVPEISTLAHVLQL